MTYLGEVSWPENKLTARNKLINYMSDAVQRASIDFANDENNPVEISRLRLDGGDVESMRAQAIDHWWGVAEMEGLQNFETKDAVVSRVAISILYPDEENYSEFSEQLSWFLEMLSRIGGDELEFLPNYFSFK
jgi:hypothetical protein